MRYSLLIGAGVSVGVVAWLAAAGPEPEKQPKPQAPAAPVATAEHKPTREQIAALDPGAKDEAEALLLEVAREYKTYTRVSDSANWAPQLCMVPPPAGVLRSVSKDEGTHGKKLYFLFARDDQDYRRLGWSKYDAADAKPFAAAVGQVIVKESFKPVEVKPGDVPPAPKPKDDDPNRGLHRQRDMPDEYTRDADGHTFRTGDPTGLFVMAKVAQTEKAGTDAGWIYATIGADLKQVTSLGRVESCMECHTKTKHDRLFGPKWLQEDDARRDKKTVDPKPAPKR